MRLWPSWGLTRLASPGGPGLDLSAAPPDGLARAVHLQRSVADTAVIPGDGEAVGKGIQGLSALALDPLPLRYAPAGDDTDRSRKSSSA